MASSSPADWLAAWFRRKAPDRTLADEELLRCNFFDAGLIDSFGVIELITEVEAEFGIRFDQNHFQDRRFPTIAGLAELIDQLRQEAPSP